MGERKVIVIGAGMGGLSAALLCAARGFDVLVLERGKGPGGKLHAQTVAGRPIDSGPTVFTMRDVFERLFESAGARLSDYLTLKPASVLARHAWAGGATLDLGGDVEENADAIGAFAGARDARGYRDFARRSAAILETLDESFMRASRPNPISLAARLRFDLKRLTSISPFGSLWDALGAHFQDPRLRQLFARYATYCGASPYLAPATLMLVAEVERRGVWYVEGGMRRLADAVQKVAEGCGARFRFGVEVERILVEDGRACGVVTRDGERLAADAVVFNGDAGALSEGLLGSAARPAARVAGPRSLSAFTLAGVAQTRGFPLVRHNVFFGGDYAQEFDAIFSQGRLPAEPTTYVCAGDREDGPQDGGAERLFCLINAPAGAALSSEDFRSCEAAAFKLMRACGLDLSFLEVRRTTPADFGRRFPATGGALYGRAGHGWRSSFTRPAARSRIKGLYLAGGSVHPGPGVPMAALSGRQAALALTADLASMRRSFPAAISGGISTPSARTGASA
jgi:1-hydroxycarotenoid 3,4-desaturase